MALFNEVTATWQGEMAFEVVNAAGKNLEVVSGQFGPMDLIVAGLAGCTGMDVIDILRKKRQNVTAFEVKVHGDRAEEHPRKYTGFSLKYVVTGHKLDPEAVRRAIDLSETKYCSVMATLRNAGPVVTEYEIREAETLPA
jgi:putative redox protein